MPRFNDAQSDDSYQVDAIVSLFAVLLVILVVLAAAVARTDGKSKLDYRSLDPTGDEITLRSLEIPPRPLDLWVLDSNELMQIDLNKIATLRAKSSRPGPSIQSMGDIRVDFSLRSQALGAWRVALYGVASSVQSDAISTRFDPNDPAALTAWADQEGRALIYVTTAGRPVLPAFDAALRRKNRPVRLSLLLEPDSPIIYSRTPGNFAYEKTFRAY